MKHTVLLVALLVLALLVSACGPAAATQAPGQSPTEAPATSEATEPPAATASPAVAATNTGSAAETTASPAATNTGTAAGTPATTETSEASVPVTGQTEVRAAANFDYGPILVNGDGLPLYIFAQDTQNGDSSACTDEECVAEWPPLTTEGEATAGPGAIQSLLGTITREDGTTQVTYNGWPLYLFSGDTSSETTGGQGAGDGWTLVSPAGKAIPAE